MADKYIDTSLTTGNNDGTSPADAWQDFYDIFTGAFATSSGSVSSGDVIHVRTADGSGDLEVSFSANKTCGLPSGTYGSPTVLLFDDGTVWPQAGTFRTVSSSTSAKYNHTINVSNLIVDGTASRRFEIYLAYSSSLSVSALTIGVGTLAIGIYLNIPNAVGYNNASLKGDTEYFKVTVKDLRNGQTGINLAGENYYATTHSHLEVELTAASNSSGYLLYVGAYGSMSIINGLKITTDNIDTFSARYLFSQGSSGGATIIVNGFECNVPISDSRISNASASRGATLIINGYNDSYSYKQFSSGNLIAEFIYGENYPTLNAILPVSASVGWSMKAIPPSSTIIRKTPLPTLRKAYTDTSKISTLTFEFLVDVNLNAGTIGFTGLSGTFSDGEVVTGGISGATAIVTGILASSINVQKVNGIFISGETITGSTSGASATSSNELEGIHKGKVYVIGSFIDTSGSSNTFDTRDHGALVSESTSGWTNSSAGDYGTVVAYGAKAFYRWKVEYTTPVAIKQDTIITGKVMHTIEEQAIGDFFFYDPDITVT